MVGITDIAYAGSHGFDIAGPGGLYTSREAGEPFLNSLEAAERDLREAVSGIAGVRVERKHFAIAVHFRQAERADVPVVEERFDGVLAKYPDLKKTGGKEIFELRPNVDWDKGKALLHMIGALYSGIPDVLPLYIGDDLTDEDAFRAIRENGIGIAVGDENRNTEAHYALRNPDEVVRFLGDLVLLSEEHVTKGVWVMAYEDFIPEREKLREALCTLGNGFFATRGAAPEADADETHYPATYAIDCYNRLSTPVSGQVIEDESLVNLPNWLPLKLKLGDGGWFDLGKMNVLEYRQELDMSQGILSRFIRVADGADRRTRITQRRFVSMADVHLAGLETTVVAENWTGRLTVLSALDGRVENRGVERYRRLDGRHLAPGETEALDDETVFLRVETNQSKIRIAEAARTRVLIDEKRVSLEALTHEEPGYIDRELSLDIPEGVPVTIEKMVVLSTSKDLAVSECGLEAKKRIARAPGF
jgi:alpha,alpha-trehalase